MAHSPHLLWLTVFVLGTHSHAFQPLRRNNVQRSLPFAWASCLHTIAAWGARAGTTSGFQMSRRSLRNLLVKHGEREKERALFLSVLSVRNITYGGQRTLIANAGQCAVGHI